jgi:glycosyltransferase involved in cell wall biosynthesis
VLLNVARISRQKNQKLLLDVMHMAAQQNVIAIILGDYVAEDKEIYDELIANKPGNVFFAGKVTNVSDYLLCADAFVLTSTFEGLPISLLEALSAGAIPVCTAVGGVINIVTDDIGFLSKEINKESFYTELQAYLNANEAAISRLKQNGRELYNKEFSMQTCAAKYDALYHAE